MIMAIGDSLKEFGTVNTSWEKNEFFAWFFFPVFLHKNEKKCKKFPQSLF